MSLDHKQVHADREVIYNEREHMFWASLWEEIFQMKRFKEDDT